MKISSYILSGIIAFHAHCADFTSNDQDLIPVEQNSVLHSNNTATATNSVETEATPHHRLGASERKQKLEEEFASDPVPFPLMGKRLV